MSIDREKLKALAEAVIKIADPWYSCDQLQMRAVDPEPAELMAEASPEVVLALIAEIDQLKVENDRMRDGANFKAIQSLRDDCEALRKDSDRYRWIEENADVDCRGHVPDGDYGSLSARIDAAMAKEAK